MSSTILAAYQLITDNKFDSAKQILASKKNANADSLYFLSLLFRYDDEYDQERKTIEQALTIDADNIYMRERLAWHELPLFDRMVPRQQLCLPRDPKTIPSPAILSQLCFVTAGGSDSPYYECLIQLLESLRATQLYKHVPIMVIDAGLNNSHKNFLTKTFSPVTIVDPGWDVDVPKYAQTSSGNRSINGLKACSARPFIPKHFPGYKYYFWLDTDTWIQDERSLDLMIDQAVEFGVSSTTHFAGRLDSNFTDSWWDSVAKEWSPPEYREFLQGKTVIAGGAFCLDVETNAFDHWQQYFSNIFEFKHQTFGPDEFSFLYTIHKHLPPKKYIDFRHVYSLCDLGAPIIKNGILSAPYSALPLGIIHFNGLRKDRYFMPMIESGVPVPIEINRQGNVPRYMRSVHYRTWPWADKPEILGLLMQEAKTVLET